MGRLDLCMDRSVGCGAPNVRFLRSLIFRIALLPGVCAVCQATALYVAAQNGFQNVVDILLRYNADPNVGATENNSHVRFITMASVSRVRHI